MDVAFTDASPTLQVSYVAAMFAEYLRGRKTSTLDQLIDLAQAANQSFDADPQVEELISLMRLAKRL